MDTSDWDSEQQMCVGKVAYATEPMARMARERAELVYMGTFTHYPCPYCKAWHVGHCYVARMPEEYT